MHKDNIQNAYMEELIKTREGQWLLRHLIERSGSLRVSGRGDDPYFAGRRDFIMTEIVQRITDNFGFKTLDIILGDPK